MRAYVIRRLLHTLPVLFGVTVVVFAILHLAPGDPAEILLGNEANAESLAVLREAMGLEDPLPVQYVNWAGRMLSGDFGRSLVLGREVLPEVLVRFEATLILTFAALFVAVVLGVGAGVIAAVRQHSIFDSGVMLVALAGVSMPVFFTGVVAILVFAMNLRWLPSAGMMPAAGGDGWDMLRHLILPAVTLGLVSAAILARMTRSAMLEVIRQDCIRTARAKGAGERRVIYVHALRNASITIVTVLGMQFGYLPSGSVIVESVFSKPGLGQMMVRAIQARDYPMVQGDVLFVAAIFVFVNLAVDLLYAWLDPRIRYS